VATKWTRAALSCRRRPVGLWLAIPTGMGEEMVDEISIARQQALEGLRISEEGLRKALADGNAIAADIYREWVDRFRGWLKVLGVDMDG